MKIFDEIKDFLPKYLSEQDVEKLFENLKNFPDNFDKRFYSNRLAPEEDVFQGDGLRTMPLVKLPNPDVVSGPVMVISNTCDTSFSNERTSAPNLIYCPIVKLSKYLEILREEGVDGERLRNKEEQIRKQRVTNIFYLPEGGELPEECIAFFDGVNSCEMSFLTSDKVKEKRLLSLSDYGFYLLVFKLGIHFTRVREAVLRG